MKIIRLKETTSTNDYVKKFVKNKQDVIVVAESQTNGRGTKGRSFCSARGGIYLSRLKFYNDLKASDGFSIIRDVSVAVVKTLLAFGVKAQIKWPNDIMADGKKICGILTENVIDGGFITQSVVGIGLNVNNLLDDSLKDIAVTIKDFNPKVDYESVLATLIFNLSAQAKVEEYVRYSCVLNKTVTITEGEKEYGAIVMEILDDGRIKLESGRILSSAEIKIKV